MVKKISDGNPEQIKAVTADYFEICRMVRRKVKACSKERAGAAEGEIAYLWVCVSAQGPQQGFGSKRPGNTGSMTMDQWLNVVDEASTLGAKWLVLTVLDPLAACESVWQISAWAQQAHGMAVGLHLKADQSLAANELSEIAKLDPGRTQILMRSMSRQTAAKLEKKGITAWSANPQPEGERPNCQGPTRMIFVNEAGVLYTCGLVKDNSDYRMGHVAAAKLKTLICNPAIPHGVENDIHVVSEGCDGCPALLANFFK